MMLPAASKEKAIVYARKGAERACETIPTI